MNLAAQIRRWSLECLFRRNHGTRHRQSGRYVRQCRDGEYIVRRERRLPRSRATKLQLRLERGRENISAFEGLFVEELTVIIFDEENCNPCCGILFLASAVSGITPKRSGSEFENVSSKGPMFSMVPVVIKRQQKRPWRDIIT